MGVVMKDFKKKPRPKTSEEFNNILDEVNGGVTDGEEYSKVGRPHKSKLEKHKGYQSQLGIMI